MRALLLAAVVVLSGCVAPSFLQTSSVDLALPELPEGATLEAIEGGLRLVFASIEFPFERNFTVPEGTTMVRVVGVVGAEERISVGLIHAETGRRRCNLDLVEAWDDPLLGTSSCTGVTMVDRLPAVWQARGGSLAETGAVHVELLTTPIDGILSELDTSQISHRDFELEETEYLRIPSFDGTKLHVEVTLPKGEGPWPTILASSPYNHNDPLAPAEPTQWRYFVRDWAERGYAVVSADVRGYGWSDGCVEVWGPKEQADQVALVEWAAEQAWSDGNVGFYGQSYVATTPVEAAVNAPEPLKAIVIVAPVTDAYNDWHFGGVPNGENLLSPIGYQETGGGAYLPPIGTTDPLDLVAYAQGLPAFAPKIPYFADHADNGFCDPTITLRPNDPRGVYDAFYAERNFSARAGDVTAAVLYTEGFEDSNVKSALIPDWFNALNGPKLGLFGHWVHQHPTRADNEALFLLWLDQYVKGKPVGFDRLPAVRVVTNDGLERVADAWPSPDATPVAFPLDPAGGAIATTPAEGSATILLDSLAGVLPASLANVPNAVTTLTLTSEPLAQAVRLAGQGQVHLDATLHNAQNAYVAAYLYEKLGDKTRLVTWGMFNVAHRNGHERYDPVGPQEALRFGIPLLPTEWAFAEGATLVLEIHGAGVQEWALTPPTEPGSLEIRGEASVLELPTVSDAGAPLPQASQR